MFGEAVSVNVPPAVTGVVPYVKIGMMLLALVFVIVGDSGQKLIP